MWGVYVIDDKMLPLQHPNIPDECEPYLADVMKFCWQEPQVDSENAMYFPFQLELL